MKNYFATVDEGKKPFKCDFCDHNFSEKFYVNRRILLVNDGKKPFQCEICDYKCSLKNSINNYVAFI